MPHFSSVIGIRLYFVSDYSHFSLLNIRLRNHIWLPDYAV